MAVETQIKIQAKDLKEILNLVSRHLTKGNLIKEDPRRESHHKEVPQREEPQRENLGSIKLCCCLCNYDFNYFGGRFLINIYSDKTQIYIFSFCITKRK